VSSFISKVSVAETAGQEGTGGGGEGKALLCDVQLHKVNNDRDVTTSAHLAAS
jgi:hypothetical protein